MSESKEEVVSFESRSFHGPQADYPRSLDLDVSESEDSEETADLAVLLSVSPSVNRSAPDLLSPDDSHLPYLDRPRVHFRSRVRISAGIGHRRRGRLSEGLSSNASSISGSPSSSISAPLRTHYTGSNNGWGPLGTRVSLLASQAAVPIPPRPRRDIHKSIRNEDGDGNAQRRSTRRSNSWMFVEDEPDERTHLMTSAQRRRAAANGYMHDRYCDDGERERRWREQLVDEAFGKWPQRLLNRDWWWWQLEPIVCCFGICGLDEAE